jgi:flagellar secretion chaperone FliS
MIATSQSKAALANYQRESVMSATPAQLVTMLYGRLVLDLRRAEAAQLEENWAKASAELVHAQAIIAELSSSLRVDVWEGGERLLGVYTYVTRVLMDANIKRSVQHTREALGLLEPLHEAWKEAAAGLAAQATASSVA